MSHNSSLRVLSSVMICLFLVVGTAAVVYSAAHLLGKPRYIEFREKLEERLSKLEKAVEDCEHHCKCCSEGEIVPLPLKAKASQPTEPERPKPCIE